MLRFERGNGRPGLILAESPRDRPLPANPFSTPILGPNSRQGEPMSPAILLFAAALLGSDTPQPATAPATAPAPPATAKSANPRVAFETTLGKFVIELDPVKAPKTVENFLGYVKSGFYDGTIFHRVIPKFMVQGGGFTADMKQKPTQPPIANEADNGLKNLRGTLSMARTMDPGSATSQFFISVVDNAFLDHTGKNPRGWGYAVFAKVVEGMDVVDKIVAVKTGNRGQFADVPETTVEITKATLLP
jgi:cyclophilin family peptidyl-prolyl cis-trans isomerase